MFLPRKRLSDITNLSVSENGNGLVPNDQKCGKTGSPVMVNEYIAKLLKENNTLMRALAERNAEMQNLRLMVAKVNQQNFQLAQSHSQMLAELNLGKDRIKATQHELGCTSATLKIKAQELEELKKFSWQNKQMQNKEMQRVENNTLADTLSQVPPSHKKNICLPDRKRAKRSLSLGPSSVTNPAATEEIEENCRKPLRMRSGNLKVGACVPSGDLLGIDDAKHAKLPKLDGREELKGETISHSSPTIQIKQEQEDGFSSGLKRTSLGRPLRRAAVKVNSYKEMPLTVKLRRPE